MAWTTRLKTFYRHIFQRAQVEQDLDAEVQAYFETLVDRYMEKGMSREEAHRTARLKFDGAEQVKQAVRDEQVGATIEAILRDMHYAVRMMAKNPGFTIVTVLTLALGIGASTAIFSGLNTVLLRPLPVKEINRLVFSVALREGFDPFGTSLVEYEAFRDRAHSFTNLGIAQQRSFNLVERGEPERIQGAAIQTEYLATLGITPIVGRSFNAEEYRTGGASVALIGYGLWQRRFGGDANLIGRSFDLEGRATTVIGILPPAFDLPNSAEIWAPYQRNLAGLPISERLAHDHELVARLKPGTTLRQADAEMKAIAKELEREYPRERAGWTVRLIWLRQELIGDLNGRIEKSLVTLTAAVGFLLLICCGNVASLLLARGVAREREIALRRALGADWWRVVRQLVTESTVLAVVGGCTGLLLAYSIVPLLRKLNPIATVGLVGPLRDIRIDGRVLCFVALVTLLTAVICALTPVAKAAAGNNLMPLVKDGGQHCSPGGAGRRWLAVLVVAELTIAVPLLAAGGLLIQSFEQLQRAELGFRPEHLLTMHVVPSPTKYPEFRQRVAFVRQVIDRVKNIPGVDFAGITTNMPLSTFISFDSVFAVEGHPPLSSNDVPITAHRVVTPEYLQTLGATLVKGRLLDAHDRAEGLPVVVISEELARQGWPNEDPVGKRIKRVRPGVEDLPWLTVVGIVKDVKEDRFNFRIDRPAWYLPYEQTENTLPLDLVVKTSGDPAAVTTAVRAAVHTVDPDQAVSNITTMPAHLAGVVVTERFSAVLMGALAVLGLTLSIIGLYGVMAYSVSRQTGEMGLRMALGATPLEIFKLVVGRGLRLIITGLSLGLLCAFMLTRFLSDALYRVNPSDPLTFGVVAVLLVAVALIACCVPARRATNVDPMVALRYE
jgi:putative ABC transport system permease protein